jgi:hypothetical protein
MRQSTVPTPWMKWAASSTTPATTLMAHSLLVSLNPVNSPPTSTAQNGVKVKSPYPRVTRLLGPTTVDLFPESEAAWPSNYPIVDLSLNELMTSKTSSKAIATVSLLPAPSTPFFFFSFRFHNRLMAPLHYGPYWTIFPLLFTHSRL